VFNPVTHGDSYTEAAQNGTIALEMLISVAVENGESLPEAQFYRVPQDSAT
jgi:predicted RNase H-like HicB family nuclease